MAKNERFQTRMDSDLKRWFYKYAKGQGGMSQVFTKLVQDLYQRATGHTWEGRNGDRNAEEASSGN
jgi:hypothetical protein